MNVRDRRAAAAGVAAALLVAAPVSARQISFHKAGVERPAHEAVELECYGAAATTMRTATVPATYADPSHGAAGQMGNAIDRASHGASRAGAPTS